MKYPKQVREFRVGDRVYHVKEKEYGVVIRIDEHEDTFPVCANFPKYGTEQYRLDGLEFVNADTEQDEWIILTHD